MFSKGRGNILYSTNTDMSNDEVILPAGCIISNSSSHAAEMPGYVGSNASMLTVCSQGRMNKTN